MKERNLLVAFITNIDKKMENIIRNYYDLLS